MAYLYSKTWKSGRCWKIALLQTYPHQDIAQQMLIESIYAKKIDSEMGTRHAS